MHGPNDCAACARSQKRAPRKSRSPEQLIATIDFSYLEDELTREESLAILTDHYNLFWIEEPTHPDDILGHATLAKAYAPHTKVAAGEHAPNRIIFKNYFQAEPHGFCQVDAVRAAGISEFLSVSLMAKQRNIPIVPHVGDMGQIHQHLVLFNHIGMGHEALLLEHIPHLGEHLKHPCKVEGGVYQTPQEPGMSSDLK